MAIKIMSFLDIKIMTIMQQIISLQLWRVSQMEFQLRSTQGQFWTCDFQGSSVSATTEAPGTNETFYIERLNNSSRIHIKLQSGIYLQVYICMASLSAG